MLSRAQIACFDSLDVTARNGVAKNSFAIGLMVMSLEVSLGKTRLDLSQKIATMILLLLIACSLASGPGARVNYDVLFFPVLSSFRLPRFRMSRIQLVCWLARKIASHVGNPN